MNSLRPAFVPPHPGTRLRPQLWTPHTPRRPPPATAHGPATVFANISANNENANRDARNSQPPLDGSAEDGKKESRIPREQRKKRSKARPVKQFFKLFDTYPMTSENELKNELRRASRLRKRGDWRSARAVLEALRPGAEPYPQFLTELIYTDGAELLELCPHITPLELFNELRGLFDSVPAKPQTVTYNAILHALQRMLPVHTGANHGKVSPKHQDVLDVAARAMDYMRSIRIPADKFTLSMLFGMCARARSLPYLKLFHEDCEDLPAMDTQIGGGALVSAYARCDAVERAGEVLDRLRKAGISPGERAYAGLIAANNRKGRHADVLALVREVLADVDVSVTPHMFTGVLASCSKSGDTENARWAMERMERLGMEMSIDANYTVFHTALKGGDMDLATEVLFDRIVTHAKFEVSAEPFNQLIASSCKSWYKPSRVEKVLDTIFDRMVNELDIPPDVATFNALSASLAHIGQYDEARRVIMEEMAEYDLRPDISSINGLMRSLGRSGRERAALELAYSLPRLKLKPDQITYNSLLEIQHASDDTKLKEELAMFLENLAGVEVASDDMVAVTSKLSDLRRSDDGVGALKLFKEGLREGKPLDSKACGLLLTILFETGLNAEAVSVFGYLLWQRQATHATYNVVMHHVGRRPEGLSTMELLFKDMKRRGIAPDEISYTTIIRRLAQHTKMDRALRLVGEMQDVGLGMSDCFAWTAVIDGCGRAGLWERGVEVLRYMVKSASNGTGLAPAPTTASYNAGLYAAGLHGRQWGVAKEIYMALLADKRAKPDPVTYSAMASIILRNRVDVREVGLIKEIGRGLYKVLKEDEENGFVGLRRTQRMSGSYRQDWKVERKKIEAKLKRLVWVLQYKKRTPRRLFDGEEEGEDGDHPHPDDQEPNEAADAKHKK